MVGSQWGWERGFGLRQRAGGQSSPCLLRWPVSHPPFDSYYSPMIRPHFAAESRAHARRARFTAEGSETDSNCDSGRATMTEDLADAAQQLGRASNLQRTVSVVRACVCVFFCVWCVQCNAANAYASRLTRGAATMTFSALIVEGLSHNESETRPTSRSVFQ